MSHSYSRADRNLKQLARLFGVQTEYRDDANRKRLVSAESIVGVLEALGASARSDRDVQYAIREKLQNNARECVPPVVIAWTGSRPQVDIRLPESLSLTSISTVLRLESGECSRTEFKFGKLRLRAEERVEGIRYITRTASIPHKPPVGYHTLEIQAPGGHSRVNLISAPLKTYSPKNSKREWGVFAPLYSLHSSRSWGAGDFGDMRDFANWVDDLGGRVVATLPMLPAYLGKPCEPSPYSPVSRLFWNEFYIDVERIPEFSRCLEAQELVRGGSFQKQIQNLRKSESVDYSRQMKAKRKVIDILSQDFFSRNSQRLRAFNRYVRSNREVELYARFRAVSEKRKQLWSDWPARLRAGNLCQSDFDEKARNYYLYAQWIAEEQIAAISDSTSGQRIQMYLDMPLGVHTAGYDAWREQDLFALKASGGAPPDTVFTKGQDWGFAPLHPHKCRTQGYRYTLQYLRHHLRHARMLRIDHVMGLHRLYWIPHGLPASHGAYVTYPAEDLYAILSIESHRHRATIVGENLGTVPPEVNTSLARHGIRKMFVSQYEARPQPQSAFRAIPSRSVASLNTHDMPPFRAFWEGSDIQDRFDLGLLDPADVVREQRLRDRIRRAFRILLQREGLIGDTLPSAEDILKASLAHLSASSAELVLINLEDLWQEIRPQNVPGTTHERVNWRRKTRLSIEQLRENPDVRDLLRTVHAVRTGRKIQK